MYDLPSAGWRPRKHSDIIQFKPEVLRTKGAKGVCSRVPRPKNSEL